MEPSPFDVENEQPAPIAEAAVAAPLPARDWMLRRWLLVRLTFQVLWCRLDAWLAQRRLSS
jgi:hypothetical protein